MMACPGEFIWPNIGDQILLVNLKPAPEDVQVRSSSDEAPSLRSFLDSAVEAEEQEDVASGDSLFVEMTLRGADSSKHSPPLVPSGSLLPIPVRFEVEVGIQVDQVQPAHATVRDAAYNACDVHVAVLKVFERFLGNTGYPPENIG